MFKAESLRIYLRAASFVAACALLVGYTPPDGPNGTTADLTKPNAHGTIVLKALDVLRSDGHIQMADFFHARRQELLNGNRRADHDGGAVRFSGQIDLSFLPEPLSATFQLFEAELPANTMSHFYNPATGEGLTLFKGSGALTDLIELFKVTPLGDYRLDTMVGPHPPATDMCDYWYARAVDSMRKGNVADAVTYLGTAVHYVADLTVPQHATDNHNGFPGAAHAEYEKFCDGYMARVRHATSAKDLGNPYSTGLEYQPGWYVHEAGARSSAHLAAAKDKARFSQAADALIPLAEKLTAALLKRFFENWQNEEFVVTAMKVENVTALSGDIDLIGGADFYAEVELDGRTFATGTLVGSDSIDPQFFLPYAWFFSSWRDGGADSIPVSVEVWDDDSGLTFDDDQIDVSPAGRAADLTYWTASREVTGDVSGSAAGVVQLAGAGDKSARLRLRFEHYPTASGNTAPTCTVTGTVTKATGGPAVGTHVFFRRPNSRTWQRVPVGEDGTYRIESVRTGRYVFRPAGSGHSFLGVPRTVDLNVGNNEVSFRAGVSLRAGSALGSLAGGRIGSIVRPRTGGTGTPLTELTEAQSGNALQQGALLVQVGPRRLGVKDNGLLYADSAIVQVHLASIVDPSTNAPLSRAPAIRIVRSPGMSAKEATAVLSGAAYGPGVPQAPVKATLWLGNPAVGYRKADEHTLATDASGNVEFRVMAGTRVEEAIVDVEVVSNPANPWSKPIHRFERVLVFNPAESGDDAGEGAAYAFLRGRPTFPVRNLPTAADLSALMTGRAGTAAGARTARLNTLETLERSSFRAKVAKREKVGRLLGDSSTLSSALRALPRQRPPMPSH